MILGTVAIDPKTVQYAEYKWPFFRVAMLMGELLITLRFRCSGFDAQRHLARLDPYIRASPTADATASSELDDSAEENENERDDLGIEVDAKKIGFKA